MKEKMILVTGGAGLIGSACVSELNAQGQDRIFIVDHLARTEKWKNLTRLQYLDYMEKDDFINQCKSSPQFIENFSHILHLGACSATTEQDSTYLIRNNYEYTKILAQLAVKNSIPFVYASSAATYGEGENGYDDNQPIASLKPLNMYGYSKHMFDLYAEKTGIHKSITGLKYFNVFGYGEAHKADMRSLVLKGYEQILKTGKLKLFKSHRSDYKDGEQKRDFLYVVDAAKISLYFLFENRPGLYNVGRGIAESWNDLAAAMFTAMGRDINIEYIDMPESLIEKYQYYTCATTDKIKKAGYTYELTPLKKAVTEYIQTLSAYPV
ncbi:ADP-glyceromanno-heptose 6-epimerase [Leptospira sp. GIMC2001]|uniref:ADP-glyceromanno-heptose 6-epimerase n=1 Tax=Leptospira sp. GIMC2001 TaxID=1513297 RepID=UPI002349AC63|nr:ADP-glyceromanno-heptose 6-epimerase [Leptospira sp. GIMC2001]WCL47837.1 ADP-glyceromanno-heptose 6-epimerase [Leptospira sp. GIMC2001]